MKKRYSLSFLTIYCYLLLWLPYSYGAAPPITTAANFFLIDSAKASAEANMQDLPILYQLIQQGNAYYEKKHALNALAIYQHVLQKYAQSYQEKTLLLAVIYDKMGISYLAIKAYPQSYYYLQQALMIRQFFLAIATSYYNETLCKPISEATGESHHHIGCLYLAINKPKEAMLSFKAALKTQWAHHIATIARQALPYSTCAKGQAVDNKQLLISFYQFAKNNAISSLGLPLLAKSVQIPYIKAKKVDSIKEALNQVPKSIQSNKEITYSTSKRKSCAQCGKKCKDQYELKRHIRIHTGEKPFACLSCDRKFARKENMKVHMLIHTGEKPFFCSRCPKRFARKNTMQKHLRTHTGEKPFSCSVCDKKFSTKHNLKVHMRTHTGEKPFACSVCGKKFIQKGNMKTHLNGHRK